MQKILNLIVIFSMMTIFSCKQDDGLLETSANVHQFEELQRVSSSETFQYKEFTGCFDDVRKKLDRPSFEETYGVPTSTLIDFNLSSSSSKVYPLIKDGEIDNLLWIKSINDGYIIQKETFINAEQSGNSAGITALFQLDPQDLTEKPDVTQISKSLGEKFKVNKTEGGVSISPLDLEAATYDAEQVYLKAKPLCDYTELADLYFIFFGFSDDSGTFPEYVFDPQIMIDAISEVLPNNGYCYCPLPCLLQTHLNSKDDIPQEIKDQMNINYIVANYDIDPLFPLDLTESSLLLDLVRHGCRPTITDACTGEAISEGEIGFILNNTLPPTTEQFYENLSEDYAWLNETEEFKNCTLLKCIYDLLKDRAGHLWCETFDEFNNMYNDLLLDVGGDNYVIDPFVQNPARNGVTGLNKHGQLAISFNPKFCDEDQTFDVLRVAKTILHEGIHADIWLYVSENLPAGQTLTDIDATTFDATFDELFTLICEDTALTDQHQEMMNNSVDMMAAALHELNGNIGVAEDYLYLAWLGIWRANDTCVESFLSEAEFIALRDQYELNITLSPSITCGS